MTSPQHAAWTPVYAELFDDAQKQSILTAFDESLKATGFVPEQTWGERIEDRGSQITFWALGQQALIDAKEHWDPDFAKRKIIQADLRTRLPGSVNQHGWRDLDRHHARGRRQGLWPQEAARREWDCPG